MSWPAASTNPPATPLGDQRWRLGLAATWTLAAIAIAFLAPETAALESYRFIAEFRGAPPTDVFPPYDVAHHAWWAAPLHSVALWLPARAGPAAYAAAQAITAAFLAPATAMLAHRIGASPATSLVVGCAAILNPYALGVAAAGPAALAAALAVAGLALRAEGRHIASLAAFVASCLCQPVVGAVAATLVVAGVAAGLPARDVRLWPLRLDRATTAALLVTFAAIAVAAVGWFRPDAGLPEAGRFVTVDILASWWVAPAALVALAAPDGRRWALLAVALAVEGLVLEAWVGEAHSLMLVAGGVALASAGAAIGGLARSNPTAGLVGSRGLAGSGEYASSQGLVGRRVAVAACIVALAAVLWVPVGAHVRQGTTADAALPEAIALVPPELRANVFVVDAAWAQVPWLSREVGFLGWADTRYADDTEVWRLAIEEAADATVVQVGPTRLNSAIRSTYGDCVVAATATHVVIEGRMCAGRGDALRASAAA